MDITKRTIAEMEAICTRFLTHHKENYQLARQHLLEIIKELPEDTCPDFCMEGELVESFEAAISMPTETMTQRVELIIGNTALGICFGR